MSPLYILFYFQYLFISLVSSPLYCLLQLSVLIYLPCIVHLNFHYFYWFPCKVFFDFQYLFISFVLFTSTFTIFIDILVMFSLTLGTYLSPLYCLLQHSVPIYLPCIVYLNIQYLFISFVLFTWTLSTYLSPLYCLLQLSVLFFYLPCIVYLNFHYFYIDFLVMFSLTLGTYLCPLYIILFLSIYVLDYLPWIVFFNIQ